LKAHFVGTSISLTCEKGDRLGPVMRLGFASNMCVGRSIQLPPRTQLHVAGEQVPSTDFVEMTEGRELRQRDVGCLNPLNALFSFA
jgi:hypothetical protein